MPGCGGSGVSIPGLEAGCWGGGAALSRRAGIGGGAGGGMPPPEAQLAHIQFPVEQ